MECNICGKKSRALFKKKVLFQYDVHYFKCDNCYFVQTEQPFWLAEAYENAITSLDIGLVGRNQYLSVVVRSMINAFFSKHSRFLDYGGGYGLLVRMLRDKGFDFYREDKFCENLFAKNFDISDLTTPVNFELITAFELFEHLPDPINEIQNMLSKGQNILFSTDLQPQNSSLETWEYIAPEIGQHISFYHLKTLEYIAQQFQMNIYTNKKNIHLLSKKKLKNGVFSLLTKRKVANLYNSFTLSNQTLLQKDYEMIKGKLNILHSRPKNFE